MKLVIIVYSLAYHLTQKYCVNLIYIFLYIQDKKYDNSDQHGQLQVLNNLVYEILDARKCKTQY